MGDGRSSSASSPLCLAKPKAPARLPGIQTPSDFLKSAARLPGPHSEPRLLAQEGEAPTPVPGNVFSIHSDSAPPAPETSTEEKTGGGNGGNGHDGSDGNGNGGNGGSGHDGTGGAGNGGDGGNGGNMPSPDNPGSNGRSIIQRFMSLPKTRRWILGVTAASLLGSGGYFGGPKLFSGCGLKSATSVTQAADSTLAGRNPMDSLGATVTKTAADSLKAATAKDTVQTADSTSKKTTRWISVDLSKHPAARKTARKGGLWRLIAKANPSALSNAQMVKLSVETGKRNLGDKGKDIHKYDRWRIFQLTRAPVVEIPVVNASAQAAAQTAPSDSSKPAPAKSDSSRAAADTSHAAAAGQSARIGEATLPAQPGVRVSSDSSHAKAAHAAPTQKHAKRTTPAARHHAKRTTPPPGAHADLTAHSLAPAPAQRHELPALPPQWIKVEPGEKGFDTTGTYRIVGSTGISIHAVNAPAPIDTLSLRSAPTDSAYPASSGTFSVPRDSISIDSNGRTILWIIPQPIPQPDSGSKSINENLSPSQGNPEKNDASFLFAASYRLNPGCPICKGKCRHRLA